ncbi:CbtA family protein [Methylomonas sp. AM2-LC]|uniref:CbtA family protein n=1 Tax=Methylomonas sp. AM2-LC TaxID=3153301 RepID=UPI00326390EE
MADFRKLVAASLLIGLLAGLFLSLLQHYQIQPLILAAERFETPITDHAHDWQPEDGAQRIGFTILFNCLTGFGFALLISSAMYWKNDYRYSQAVLWTIAGYLVFFGAPALGLPPELPGTDSAELQSRQAWWLFTSIATSIGLYGLFFGKNLWLQLASVTLMAAPHLVGAPHPDIMQSSAPEALQQRFVWMSVITNGLFWLALGVFSGWYLPKVNFKS